MEITTVGDIPDALYIVTVGVVCVVMHGEEIFEARKGDVFGENALLGLSLDGRRQRTCIAKTMCELCRLDKDDLSSLLTIDEFRDPLNIMIQTHLANLEAVATAKVALEARMLFCVDWARIKRQIEAARSKDCLIDDGVGVHIRRVISQNTNACKEYVVNEVNLVFKSIKIVAGARASRKPAHRHCSLLAWI